MKKFISYYQDELSLLRKKGGVFAKIHPDVAANLDIKNGESSDPHTERIIEAVAFMAAKIHQKIDDNAQEIAGHLLSALYPNLVNIFPPCSVARFEASGTMLPPEKVSIPRETDLFVTSKEGVECLFKTIYPLNLYPITITDVGLVRTASHSTGTEGWHIKIDISSKVKPLEKITLSDMLFHINSEITDDALLIYSAIFSDPNKSVYLMINGQRIEVNPRNIVQCGFSDTESVCPVPRYSTNSLQLFQEMMHFRRKFMFFRITDLDKLIVGSGLTEITDMSLFIGISLSNKRLHQIVDSSAIMLNATPIVNLFKVTSDPFRFDGTKPKYLLWADQVRDRSIEIHSITEMHMIDSGTKDDMIVQPYFALSVDADTNITHDVFWLASKDLSEARNLDGFDTYISLVDTKMNPWDVYDSIVYAKTLCTNRFEARDIPTHSKMTAGSMETAGYSGSLLYNVSLPVSFQENFTMLWELVSQLSALHISIAGSHNMLSAVKKFMAIFEGSHKSSTDWLANVVDISITDIVRRFGNDAWRGFVRGREISVSTKEENGAPISYFCCCILNQYLSSIISLNSFIQLKLMSSLSGKPIATWLPTSGRSELM
ncbi:MAG: type VI secretion system baseplate subunit TssF [Holosporales bacterium]|jgi:type VI secretion system protein ImpG|nr:type VI secretion system baseplate subunit TssF [Holosporales bacterium]